jgi:hypothetical protein
MKLLSFDVGIKNLAYCLLNSETNAIEGWGVLNISVDPVCEHCLTTGAMCDKTAKGLVEGRRLCASHLKLKQYRDQKSTKIPKIKNPTLEIGKRMVTLLESHPEFLEVECVLIENQPALKNPTMKSIQMMVYTFFLVRGITNPDSPMESLEMVNARNKLKAYPGPEIPCTIQDRYKRTKYLAIHSCEWMLHANECILETFREQFATSKKQDDLSDAYLQGMYWLTK